MSNTTLVAQIVALAQRAATEDATLHGLVATANTALATLGTNVGTLTALNTADKGTVVAAINDIFALVNTAQTAATAAGTAAANANTAIAALVIPAINDTTASANTVYSSSKVDADIAAQVNAAVTALVGGAPAQLDTLKELATALTSDESIAATLATTVDGKLAKSANLSDLASIPAALTTLGVSTTTAMNAAIATATASGTQASTDLATLNTAIGTIPTDDASNPFVDAFNAIQAPTTPVAQ